MRVESVRWAALSAAALVLVALVAGPSVVVASSVGTPVGDAVTTQTTEIRSCTTITEPGRYVLATDIENATETCIEIRADGVTFSGAGHVIDGSDSQLARRIGIRVTDAEDVLVRNVTLSDWGFAGVYLRGVTENRIRNVTAIDNRFGITVRSSEQLRIADSNATNNSAAGIDVSATRKAVVAGNVVANNRVGISLTTTSRRNRIVRNVIRGNELGLVVSNANNNVVTTNAFCGNRNAIVALEDPSHNLIENNDREC